MAHSLFRSIKADSEGYSYRQLRRLGISDATALSVMPRLKQNSFDSGTVIWSKGGLIESWNLIVTGLIVQYSPIDLDRSIPVHIYGPGSWFGEESIINHTSSSLGYECLTDIDAISLPKETILGLLEQDIRFSTNFSKITAARLQRRTEAQALQKYGNPCMKVVLGIAQIVDALLAEHDLGQAMSQLNIPVTQTVLASVCGVARTAFSTYVLQLERLGWIQISYGKLEVLNLKQWRDILNRHRKNRLTPMFDSVEELILLIKNNQL